jgi:hypothetical protein
MQTFFLGRCCILSKAQIFVIQLKLAGVDDAEHKHKTVTKAQPSFSAAVL